MLWSAFKRNNRIFRCYSCGMILNLPKALTIILYSMFVKGKQALKTKTQLFGIYLKNNAKTEAQLI